MSGRKQKNFSALCEAELIGVASRAQILRTIVRAFSMLKKTPRKIGSAESVEADLFLVQREKLCD